MGNLLIGVAMAWVSFSEQGRKLRAQVLAELKKKYMKNNDPTKTTKEGGSECDAQD